MQATEAGGEQGQILKSPTILEMPCSWCLSSLAACLCVQAAEAIREQTKIRNHVDNLLKWNAVLMVPAAVSAPPAIAAPAEEKAALRLRLVGLNSIAGLCGLPQVCSFDNSVLNDVRYTASYQVAAASDTSAG